VVSPGNSPCKVTWAFRLNLPAGEEYTLGRPDLELSSAVLAGAGTVEAGGTSARVGKHDSFFLPGGQQACVRADTDLIVYIGGGPAEGVGRFFVRHFDPTVPVGEIHQVHGQPPYRRTVWMCAAPTDQASRLITGLTWGDDGGWTSWPPHQHSRDLEEIYWYFDLPAPGFALHLSYTQPGCLEAVHPVRSGDVVLVPEGYHPTVAAPGFRSSYFWIMSAHCRASRRYDLSVPDPGFAGGGEL
jgi:5-deoxy-glucuronate isomerase